MNRKLWTLLLAIILISASVTTADVYPRRWYPVNPALETIGAANDNITAIYSDGFYSYPYYINGLNYTGIRMYWTGGDFKIQTHANGAFAPAENLIIDAPTVTIGDLLVLEPTLFAALGASSNGTVAYCSDCSKATPCTDSGTGALAKRLNGAWDCD